MNMKSLLFGLAVGDALGVPVEFKPRSYLKDHPVTGMIGGGTHNQPSGTWSDDTSLALCLADSLDKGFDLTHIAQNIIKWRTEGLWTPHGKVFDVGVTTDEAIQRLRKRVDPEKAGGTDEQSNGNGSLMRIAPLVFYVKDKPVRGRWEITKKVSFITHGHARSAIACFYYLEFARLILDGLTKSESYGFLKPQFGIYFDKFLPGDEKKYFNRLLIDDIHSLSESKIRSDGYVIHTLEASMWSLLTTDNYRDAVLKAVNLGYDSDTTGAVTGAMAGLLYGYDAIPEEWVNKIARKEEIKELADVFEALGL